MPVVLMSLIFAALVASCSAQADIASAPSYARLPLVRVTQQGIVPFLAANPKYSLFLELLQADKDYESLITQAWAQGPTNNTVLAATNDAVESALDQLNSAHRLPTNASAYVNLAYGGGTLSTAATTLLSAIFRSHILTAPLNLYADQSILTSTINGPVALPASGVPPAAAPAAYSSGEGIEKQITVTQQTGLGDADTSIPQVYTHQLGQNSALGGATGSLYFYEVSSVLIASEIMDQSGAPISVLDAINELQAGSS